MQTKGSFTQPKLNNTRSLLLLLFFCLLVEFTPQAGRASPSNPSQFTVVNKCSDSEESLRIKLLNVGQGEAILISCPGQKWHTLIDGGDCSENYPFAEEMFKAELTRGLSTDSRFKYIINTHAHPDHICGLKRLILGQSFPFEAYLDNGIVFEQFDLVSLIHQHLNQSGGKHIIAPADQILSLNLCPGTPGVVLQILPQLSESNSALDCRADFNHCSLVSVLSYLGFKMLLQADARTRWEELAMQDPQISQLIKADVLKVGHHASSKVASKEFLKHVSPQLVVFSAGQPGMGKTDQGGYTNSRTIKRISNYLRKHQPVEHLSLREMEVCQFGSNKCVWIKKEVHPWLRGTTQGTIEINVSEGQICFSQEKEEGDS